MFNPYQENPRSIIKKEDGFLAYFFSAQMAYLIVRAFERLSLRPNHYTFASLVLGFLAAYLFSRGDVLLLLIGVAVLHVSFIFDCCDGQVSRLKGLGSKMGHWFDYHSDKLKDGAELLGLSYGAFVLSGKTDWWIFVVAFIVIFFQFLRNITALNRDLFTLEHRGKKDDLHSPITTNEHSSQLLRTLKHSALFKLSDRVLLFTVIVVATYFYTEVLSYGIIFYACLEVVYALLSAYMNYRLFYRFDKQQS